MNQYTDSTNIICMETFDLEVINLNRLGQLLSANGLNEGILIVLPIPAPISLDALFPYALGKVMLFQTCHLNTLRVL